MKKTAFIIIVISLSSKILGLLRELSLSYFYGASNISDAYIIALTIPTVIFTLVGSAFSNGFIPMYSRVKHEESLIKADCFTSNLTNILFLFFSLLIVLSLFFTTNIVKVFASGFEGETLELAVFFTRISVFGIYFTSLVQLYSGYLQIKGNFTLPALLGFPLNICIILTILLSSYINIVILPIGIVLATALQFFILIPSLSKFNYKHRFRIDFYDKYIHSLVKISIPVILGAIVNDVNVLVDKTIASNLAEGGISALNYASRLNNMIISVFVLSLSTTIYPSLSRLSSTKNFKELRNILIKSINVVLILIIPSSIGIIVLNRPIIEILYGRGAFDQIAIDMTSRALIFYSIGMVGIGVRQILVKGFYSTQNTKSPVLNSSIALILNIVLNIILSKIMGVSGLALATSISAILSSVLLMKSFKRNVIDINYSKIFITLIKVLISSIIMGLLLFLINKYLNLIWGNFITIIFSIVLSCFVYYFLLRIFKVDDIDSVNVVLKKTISKLLKKQN